MTSLPDNPPPRVDEAADEDWFGEGSAFDSGEDLAAALMALAGTDSALDGGVTKQGKDWGVNGGAGEEFEPLTWPVDSLAGLMLGPPPEFQVAPMPSSVARSLRERGPAPSRWFQRTTEVGAQRKGWAIRQSVQTLKTTENIITRLREEAVDLTWRAAGLAVVRSDVVPPRRIRREIRDQAAPSP